MTSIDHQTVPFVVGWSEHGTIPEACDALSDVLVNDIARVLLTSIDSSRTLPELQSLRHLAEGERAEPIGSGLLVEVKTLFALLEDDNFFTGFDELWAFPHGTVVSQLENVHFTSERPAYDLRLGPVISWMRQSGCLFGLGDGCGLNVITPRPSIMTRLTAADATLSHRLESMERARSGAT